MKLMKGWHLLMRIPPFSVLKKSLIPVGQTLGMVSFIGSSILPANAQKIGDQFIPTHGTLIAHETEQLRPWAACYHVTTSNTGELNTSFAERATNIISTAGQTVATLVQECQKISPTDMLLAGGETKEQLPTSTVVGNLLEIKK